MQRFGLFAALVATTLLTLFAVVLAGAAVLSTRGSISLAFLSHYLADALNDETAAVRIDFDDTVLAYDRRDGRLDIRLARVTVRDAEGRRLAAIPEVGLRLNGRALLERRIEVEQVKLLGPRLHVMRSQSGRFELAFGRDDAGSEDDLLATWLRGDWPGPIRTLHRIRVQDASLAFDDRMLGKLWRARRADLALNRGAYGMVLDVDAWMDLGERTSRISIEASYVGPERPTVVDVSVADLATAPLLDGIEVDSGGPLASLASLPALLDGSLSGEFDRDWRLLKLGADLRLRLAEGPARLNVIADYRGTEQPLRLDARLVEVAPTLLAEALDGEASVALAAVRAPLSGHVALRMDAAWKLLDADFALTAGAGELAPAGLYQTPLAIAKAEAVGRLEGPTALSLDRLSIDFGDGRRANFAGSLTRADAGIGVIGKGGIDGLTVADLPRYWPATLHPNARRWVLGHVEKGRLPNVRFSVNANPGDFELPASREDLMLVTFDYAGVDCLYWSKMPRLSDANGHGRIDGNTVEVTVDAGNLDDIAISEGRIVFVHSKPGPEVAQIDFLSRGNALALLTLLDRDPLFLARDMGLDIASAGGLAEVRTHLGVPLLADLKAREIDYRASGTLSDFALAGAFSIYDLSHGALTLEVTRNGLDGRGTMSLAGVPVTMTWRRDFGETSGKPSSFTISARLDDAGRKALGVDLAPYLSGVSSVDLALTEDRHGLLAATGTADLRDARLALQALKWEKPSGRPATAVFAFKAQRHGKGIEVERFRVAGEGFAADGHASYAPDQSRIVLQRLRVDQQDIGVDVRFGAGAPTKLRLTGASLDLREMLDGEQGATVGGDRPATAGEVLDIEVAVDRVLISDRFRLVAVSALGRRRGERWEMLRATGKLNDGPEVEVNMRPEDDRHQELNVLSTDAGAVFAASDIVTGTTEGSFRLKATLPEEASGDEAIKGEIVAKDFRLIDAPVFTRILSMASVTGLLHLMRGEGIHFDRLEIPFRKRGDVIRFRDARASGPALGITMSGTIDTGRDWIDFEGAVVPAYTLNSALGGIPILGTLLVGREGEGIFALSYRVQGPATDPSVSVNPLSALAPGFLRRIVELFSGSGRAPPIDDKQYFEPSAPQP